MCLRSTTVSGTQEVDLAAMKTEFAAGRKNLRDG